MRIRSLAFVTLVAGAVFLPAIVVLSSHIDDRKMCQVAGAWAKEHAGNLPSDFDSLVSLPLPYRRAALAYASTAVKTKAWDEQFARLLLRSDLTDPQRRFVSSLRAQLPSLLGGSSAPPASATVKAIFSGRPDLLKAFTQLGPDSGNRRTWQGFLLMTRDAFWNLGSSYAYDDNGGPCQFRAGQNCRCSSEDDWCDVETWGPCEVSMVSDACIYLSSGCGWLNGYPCNGCCGGFTPWPGGGH